MIFRVKIMEVDPEATAKDCAALIRAIVHAGTCCTEEAKKRLSYLWLSSTPNLQLTQAAIQVCRELEIEATRGWWVRLLRMIHAGAWLFFRR